jgi:hypothetical protein
LSHDRPALDSRKLREDAFGFPGCGCASTVERIDLDRFEFAE